MIRPTTESSVDNPAVPESWRKFAASADEAKGRGEHPVGPATDFIHRASGLEGLESFSVAGAFASAWESMPDTEKPHDAWYKFVVGPEEKRQPVTATAQDLGSTALHANTA